MLRSCDKLSQLRLLVYCSDFRCSHLVAISADQWPDELRLSDLEPRFVCRACGNRGAKIRPDFDGDKPGARSPARGQILSVAARTGNIINICQLAPQWSSSMDDRAMCEKCRKLDEKIAHYREVATWVMDERTLEGIEMLIRNLEAEKAALHR